MKHILKSLFILFIFNSSASQAEYTAVVIDADNGKVLHEVSATQPWFPASLTKVMTLYLTFNAIKSGLLKLDDAVPVSSYASQQPNSKLGLIAGQMLTVQEAISAIITRSANDAAVALAEKIGGTEAKFATQMTSMARDLNMTTTTFYNATGLPHSRQVTSSRDMALLASRVRKDFKEFFGFFSLRSINFNGRVLPNINSFLNFYNGAEGMKTGFTCASGYNLMASAKRNGRHLIGIIMGANTREERNFLMAQSLDIGFATDKRNAIFNSLEQMQMADTNRPVYQLPAETCRYDDYSGFARRSQTLPHVPKFMAGKTPMSVAVKSPSLEELNQISRWTVILAAFNERPAAEEFNQTLRKNLDKLSKLGYPVVVQHETDGLNLWHALWTGISDAQQASTLCKYLWESDIECSVLSPEVIASSEAPWR